MEELIEQACDKCRPIIKLLVEKIKELEKKLLLYENANTPSSKLRFPPKKRVENPQKAGQKEGHKGITRDKPDPTMTLEVVEEKCPHCKTKLGKPFKTTSKIIEEIPKPQPVEVTEYKINHYICKHCKIEVVAKSPFPEHSRFGANALTHITLLKFEDRLPLRKVVSALQRQFNLTITSGTVFDITRRVSDKLQGTYEKIKKLLRKAEVVYIDETTITVNGVAYWLWVFTFDGATLYVVRKSRGKNVIEEILGEDFDGVIVCDGWTSYPQFTTKLQRCWAHLLREAKFLAEKFDSAKGMYIGLKKLFEKTTKKRKPPSKEKAILELQQWVDYAESYKELRKFAVKIKNGLEYWFTFLTNKKVEPTNNRAERALRELIIQRKIIGTLRNEKGTTIFERVNTALATWKQGNINVFDELKAQLC